MGKSNQKIFDDTVRRMYKQGECCYDKNGKIYRYRFKHLRCPGGMQIPDHLYSPRFENKWVTDREITPVLEKIGFDENNIRFVKRLQEAHDMAGGTARTRNTYFLKEFFQRCRIIAIQEELSTRLLWTLENKVESSIKLQEERSQPAQEEFIPMVDTSQQVPGVVVSDHFQQS